MAAKMGGGVGGGGALRQRGRGGGLGRPWRWRGGGVGMAYGRRGAAGGRQGEGMERRGGAWRQRCGGLRAETAAEVHRTVFLQRFRLTIDSVRILDMIVCSRPFSPAWDPVDIVLDAGFICPFMIIDPEDLGLTHSFGSNNGQAKAKVLCSPSSNYTRRRIPALRWGWTSFDLGLRIL